MSDHDNQREQASPTVQPPIELDTSRLASVHHLLSPHQFPPQPAPVALRAPVHHDPDDNMPDADAIDRSKASAGHEGPSDDSR